MILFVQSLLLVAFPLPVRVALDMALTPGARVDDVSTILGVELSHLTILIFACVGSLTIGLLMTTFEFLDERFTNRSIVRLVNNMRLQLLGDLLSRQFAYLERKIKVDILGRVSGDTQNLELFVSTSLVVAFRSIPSLLFAVVSMFIINTRFAFLMLLLIPAFYASITFLSKKIKQHEKEHRSRTNLFEHESLQALSSLSLLKSLQGEGEALQRLQDRQQQINQTFLQSRFFTALLNSVFSGSRHIIRALVLLLGGYAILQGQLTLGSLFAFVSYLEALNRPVGEIANFISRYGKASASLERIQELSQEQSAFPEKDGTLSLPSLASTDSVMKFNNVAFAYGESAPLFTGLNLNLQRRQLVAIVGPSGVGKSSFIKLLNRLHDPSEGVITLTSVAINDLALRDLRRHVCLISQDPFFVSGTVRDNLLLALPSLPTDEDLWLALEKVNATEFVKALPQGLDTLIGESGLQLSGGQSKRLSLARGFLRAETASVFVFDEPTSGLDPVSAAHVISSLRELADKKELVLFSTHRVSEFEIADQVLFFAKHQVPALASHESLLNTNATYRELTRQESNEVPV
ncbi:ABC transporter, nucleotide binding/ATPase protein [Bdellovibrio bacteriovorus str. Tiberius]|uniref:ABC transporter, nucleotide binding/ATPase protein n=1 Tax=Bdellovibrio bacteriovorus str. Tiberius TaxID=1069642 RepID=K7ZGD6_BDEBC|nr:ABC transporter, nucleotide binding/ATPase protein [Bdellovibrio bacteriovorus str. Tiberius]